MTGMIKYFLVFFISTIFAYISEINYKTNKKKIATIFSLIAIFIPCLMAGLRASGVGTDTKVYINGVFIYIVNHVSTISDLLVYINQGTIEPLYMLFNFLISKISSNLCVLYFALEVLIILPAYFGCKKLGKRFNVSSSLCYLIFLILFFNKSLNMCRQAIAMSICFYSLDYVFDKKLLKYITCMIVAFLFHRSTIIFLPVYFIYKIINNGSKKDNTIIFLSVLILLFSVLVFKNIVEIMISIGALSEKYKSYIYVRSENHNIKFIEIFSEFIVLCLSILSSKKLIKISNDNKLIIYCTILSFIMFLFGFNAAYSQRISYYYSLFLIPMLPQISMLFHGEGAKKLINIVLIIMLCVYSTLYYGKYTFDQTVPYRIDKSETKSNY